MNNTLSRYNTIMSLLFRREPRRSRAGAFSLSRWRQEERAPEVARGEPSETRTWTNHNELPEIMPAPDDDYTSIADETVDAADESRRIQVETMIVSDIHLGSDVSRSAELLKLLKRYRFSRLILNGDVFDDLNFKRLRKEDWKFLSYIRKLSNPKKHCQVIWVAGNHDGFAEPLSHLLGVEVYDEYIWESGGKRYLATHGHQFDTFINERVIITAIASYLYLLVQRVDGEKQRVSRWVKRSSKSWLHISEKIAQDAMKHGARRRVDYVFCGHTHIAMEAERDGVRYCNSGCWTDRPSQYITIDRDEGVRIRETD